MKKDHYKSTINVKAFCPNDREIVRILELCRLKPSVSWKLWIDDFGHSCFIVSPEEIRTSTESKQIYSDLYWKATPSKILSISNYILIGANADYSVIYVWLHGKDDRVRLLLCRDGQWLDSCSPVITGIDCLRSFVKNEAVEGPSAVASLNVKAPIVTELTTVWATPWPVPQGQTLQEPFYLILKGISP